jgi:hypothetical protein
MCYLSHHVAIMSIFVFCEVATILQNHVPILSNVTLKTPDINLSELFVLTLGIFILYKYL